MTGVAFEWVNNKTPLNDTNLNNMQSLLFDMIYPVGTYYETSNTEFNPNETWGGTWEQDTSGTVLVSQSSTSGSKFNVDVGTVVGEETHTMTENELVKHKHNLYGAYDGEAWTAHSVTSGGEWACFTTEWNSGTFVSETGSSTPFNVVQPSTVIIRWHRTA